MSNESVYIFDKNAAAMLPESIKPGYARISDILRPWINFEKIPPEVLEHKRIIGTQVHEAIYLYNECLPQMCFSSDAEGYFDSYLEWTSDSKAKIIQSEQRLYDDQLKITGKYDSLVKFPDEDEYVMVDWKTSSSFTRETGITWHLQGTFYHYLLQYNDVPNISNRFLFIQLDPKGKRPKVREFEYTVEMIGNCMAALQVYRLYNPI